MNGGIATGGKKLEEKMEIYFSAKEKVVLECRKANICYVASVAVLMNLLNSVLCGWCGTLQLNNALQTCYDPTLLFFRLDVTSGLFNQFRLRSAK